MVDVPKTVIVNTGDQHLVQGTIDQFFLEIKKEIERAEKLTAGPSPFEIKSGEISYSPGVESNDRITNLYYLGTVAAGVLETRTEFNHVQFTFFKNSK